MAKKHFISRRTFLRGAGAALALPWLEIMMPVRAYAQSMPKRLLTFIFPSGVPGYGDTAWTPNGTGTNYTLNSDILGPLQNLRAQVPQISMISGLRRPNGGGGAHPWAASALLTGSYINISPTTPRAGISFDQVIANSIGSATRMPSLVASTLSLSSVANNQMAPAYYNCISWKSATEYIQPIIEPIQVFDRITSGINPTDPAIQKRRFYNQSILDAVQGDILSLKSRLGQSDNQKLDEYLQSVRDVERTMAGAPGAQCSPGPAPSSSPQLNHDQKMNAMLPLLKLALQCDQTRVISFLTQNEQPYATFEFIGVPREYSHHTCSHYQHAGASGNLLGYLKIINRYYVAKFVALVESLRQINEGDGTALDNTLILFGSGFRNPDNHEYSNLPLFIVGGKNLGHRQGRHIVQPDNTPVANLLLTLIQAYGINANQFGNSTGTVPGLIA